CGPDQWLAVWFAPGADVTDLEGNPVVPGAFAQFGGDGACFYDDPTVAVAPVAPAARDAPVDQVTVTFSLPVAGFDPADLRLTRNGQVVPLTGCTLSEGVQTDGVGYLHLAPQQYTLTGLRDLTAADGTYALTVLAGGSGISNDILATDYADDTHRLLNNA